jgi:hypothetical protein
LTKKPSSDELLTLPLVTPVKLKFLPPPPKKPVWQQLSLTIKDVL